MSLEHLISLAPRGDFLLLARLSPGGSTLSENRRTAGYLLLDGKLTVIYLGAKRFLD